MHMVKSKDAPVSSFGSRRDDDDGGSIPNVLVRGLGFCVFMSANIFSLRNARVCWLSKKTMSQWVVRTHI